MTDSVPRVSLATGATMPQVGLGVFKVPPGDTQGVVENALEIGFRHIDTASAYHNEAEVGAALRAAGLPRGQLFVTTKLRNGDQGREQARVAFERSLADLGLDYVDLYLVHWPVPTRDRYLDTWRTFEDLFRAGLARAIGVSNFLPEHLTRLLAETDVTPAVNQIEVHPTFANREAVVASVAAGCVVQAYSPLGRGRDLADEVTTAIAADHGVSAAQVILRWHVQQGRVVLPKSVHRERMALNLDVFDFSLSDDEMARLDGLDAGNRLGRDPRDFDDPQL